MKIFKILLFALMLLGGFSCKKFLDQVPAERMVEADLFKTRDAAVRVLTQIYAYRNMETDIWSSLGLIGDEEDIIWPNYPPDKADRGVYSPVNGLLSRDDAWTEYYRSIRTALYFLAHIDECTDPRLTEQEKTWWKGEAEFFVAYYYFMLFKQFGPVVLIDHVMTNDEIAASSLAGMKRATAEEMVNFIDAKLASAREKLSPSWQVDQQPDRSYRADKTVCDFLRARLWLYYASPLYNGLKNPTTNKQYSELVIANKDGSPLVSATFDPERWAKAKQYAMDAITTAAAGGYGFMMDQSTSTLNTPGLGAYKYVFNYSRSGAPSKECIFTNQSWSPHNVFVQHAMPFRWGGYSGMSPIMEHVNEYFMANGLMPEDDQSWINATGFFNYTFNGKNISIYKKFTKRDPRFYSNILFPGQYSYAMLTGANEVTNSKWGNNSDDSRNWYRPWYDGPDGFAAKTGRDYSSTGFICIKYVPRNIQANLSTNFNLPMWRYTELLLNYIEAAFEYDVAKGIDPLGNGQLFAYWKQIRDRVGIADVKAAYNTAGITLTVPKLRELIHRERRIELAFEGHRFYDNRRWLDAEREGGPKRGFNILKSGNDFWDPNYVFETRVFNTKNYFQPIPQSEIDKNPLLSQNPLW